MKWSVGRKHLRRIAHVPPERRHHGLLQARAGRRARTRSLDRSRHLRRCAGRRRDRVPWVVRQLRSARRNRRDRRLGGCRRRRLHGRSGWPVTVTARWFYTRSIVIGCGWRGSRRGHDRDGDRCGGWGRSYDYGSGRCARLRHGLLPKSTDRRAVRPRGMIGEEQGEEKTRNGIFSTLRTAAKLAPLGHPEPVFDRTNPVR